MGHEGASVTGSLHGPGLLSQRRAPFVLHLGSAERQRGAMAEHTTTSTLGPNGEQKFKQAKRGYTDEGEAAEEAARMGMVRPGGNGYSHYRCGVCGLWHVGRNRAPGQPIRTLNLKRRRAAAMELFGRRAAGALVAENDQSPEGRMGYIAKLAREAVGVGGIEPPVLRSRTGCSAIEPHPVEAGRD